MFSAASKVLITGINGFTGRYVQKEFEQAGWDVWGTGKSDVSQEKYIACDLTDIASLERLIEKIKPDAVVHLAGISFIAHANIEDFYRVNLIGTRNLLSALATSSFPPQCVLLASSANVYGNNKEGVLDEKTLPNPMNEYAVCKLAMEHIARLWEDTLPTVIVRPFNYTGIGQREIFVLPKIVAHFRRQEKEIELGNLDVWRDFSDVRTVAQVYRKLVECRPVGKTVNVCSGTTHSLREVLTVGKLITGHSLHIKKNQAFVRENEIQTLAGDPSLLRSLIGDWHEFVLQDTLAWMLGEKI